MPTLINGSPTHALIVHAVVVLLPLSVLGALLLVFVPAARRSYAVATLAVAFVACLAVPLAFASGGALRERVPASPLIDHHVAMAHQLLPVAAVFGLALALFVGVDLRRRSRRGDLNPVEAAVLARMGDGDRPRDGRARDSGARDGRARAGHRDASGLQFASAVVLVLASLVTAVAVARAGDSGAKAAWHGRLLPAGASAAER